ncbi:2-amino-3-ketobutyrate coenzyme A ligase, putative [Trypanosoma equiperdum]|uniref:2-amino-3-ketobutyrate coenzyme A ligase, mitochondrial n=3 Tax=Trypanozoon TaxID=39700 RepID=Q57YK7_TRYB2|nr:2-amino-3-ketobutyrate coenzyme A ligase,putative [Trypanosoma brucei gambiense DAL972]XP_847436.1 2-amino-3-ketobutyrate coenzyme A ligase, putative [Trypanosoma brucei brucei TREU927]AAX69284.1 2-amino-3-ketobutyrate coenzyme A ligase, putative [Trypanosoma brucei]SCU64579.1 2-amino-3-ketobutyrate coenzyme A ligase, putative [Trypanosoma equiperdum]AAZ13370.1 2-amino-3-ketobutyrate coenzyme A ligase, putative [Trypanosoma brucei brucei TREU927]CBH13671.1 2-amino-3-ketobutyrate coenzyme A |eukprot:XP_011775947.1 2-amino-3-ketobutyrate coenzyme A ligase,putative [Trypanosoma brucei gambiense DAL972]
MFRTVPRYVSSMLREAAAAQLAAIKEAGTYKVERVITSKQSSTINVSTAATPVLNFCANNYLGLADHPEVIQAAKDALDSHGYGLASVRFICGTTDIHKKLEQTMTEFLGMEDTILYPSCFDANAGVFEALLTSEDAIISDALNHASIIDGVRLCKAERHRYAHLDMKELETALQKTQHNRIRLIVTDGVFSMDGDVAPLDKIVQLAEKYNANVMVDDSHASGFMGPGGRGTPALFGVIDKVDILNTTLGKALGGASGGLSSGCKEIVDLQRQKGRPYLFSNTIAPAAVGGTLKVMELLQTTSSARKQLQDNTHLFRTEMKKAGFTLSGHEECPIAPVMLYEARIAAEFAAKMMAEGIYVTAFSYPVVPKGQARIRVQLSAAHTTEDVKLAVDAFTKIKKELNV